MPRKNKQAIKRHKQNVERRARNRHVKATVKSRVKSFLSVIEGKETEKSKEAYKEAQAQLDKAARKKVIHRRAAARKVSRLARKLNKKTAAG